MANEWNMQGAQLRGLTSEDMAQWGGFMVPPTHQAGRAFNDGFFGQTPGTGFLSNIGEGLSNIPGSVGNWFKETPWMGQHGILSTGMGLAQGVMGIKGARAQIKGMDAQRKSINQQMALNKMTAGKTLERQGALRQVNEGVRAPDAIAAGERYSADQMSKWGLA